MAEFRKPKKFKKEEFKQHVLNYFEKIYDAQADAESSPEPPTFFGFYRYVSGITECSYNTVRRSFDQYWADIKKEFEEMRADLLVRGTAMGKYNSTIAIFALKNWCKWTDKQEVTTANIDDQTRNEVNSLVESINDYEADENESD
jgi:hypothetical protein